MLSFNTVKTVFNPIVLLCIIASYPIVEVAACECTI